MSTPATTARTEVRYQLGEVVYARGPIRIQRARRRADNLPVILKCLDPDAGDEAQARFRKEARLLRQFEFPGVIRIHEFLDGAAPVMVLEEMGAPALDQTPVPLPLEQFLRLASALSETLAAVHDAGVIHKDINPANILFNRETGEFRLIDFAIADELPQRTMAPRPPSALEGTLAFISPEQTGRMNRAVDYRTDFYSLGITFYWLLTGALPFEAPDDLGLIHCHLAARPTPPHLRNGRVPETVSSIVLKLMAKMAEERYQSARGLKADLDRCLAGLFDTGAVPAFTPGLEDFTDRLQMPQRLYGREREIAQLQAALARTAGGATELLLVAGYSGVGKTALVRELQKPVLERRGYFAEGKFDQLRRNIPYSGLAQAFEEFVSQVLMEDEARLAAWKGKILEAVRSNGALLTDVVPLLEQLIGPQPPVPARSVGETQNRFVFLVIDFIKAIASAERPLVLFLDDVQWIDANSLALLHQLARAREIHGLLLICGYRDNEVDRTHPFSVTLEALRAEGITPPLLTVGNLTEETTNELIAHMLRTSPQATAALTRIVHTRTGGNVFFTLQTLKSLAESGAIRFDAQTRLWRWDLSTLDHLAISDNVLSLMEARLQTLPAASRDLLKLAACLGFRFSLAHVSIAAERTDTAVLEDLQPALRDGLLLPSGAVTFRFAHDRVRQAAYSLIPEGERARTHLDIGRLLQARLPDDASEDQLFTVTDNLDAGSALLEEERHRIALAQLNLRAGDKARRAAAFDVAAHYFRAGYQLLPSDCWQRHYALALALHKETAQCEYLSGHHDLADTLIATALANAADAFDKAEIHGIQVLVYTTRNRFAESVAAGFAALRLFGMDIPDTSDPVALRAAADRALAQCRDQLAQTDPARLIQAEEMTDRQAKVCMDLLLHMALAAYFLNRSLYTLLTATMANLALRNGNSSATALGYVLMAATSVTEARDFRTAKALGEVALQVNRRFANPALEGEILMFYANTVAPWFLPLTEAAPLQRRGFAAAVDAGALNDAANCLWGLLRNSLVSGAPLDEPSRECENAIAFTERIHDSGFRVTMVFMRQVIRCLQGALPDPARMDAEDFNEHAFLEQMRKSGFYSTLVHYNIFKTWILFVAGQFDGALAFIELNRENVHHVADQPHSAYQYFHHSLLLLRRPLTEEALALIAENQERLALFAEYCPDNYRHLHTLVEAERAWAAGRFPAAAELYDQAIEWASRSGNHYVEAIACEWAGRFWLAQGNEASAASYLQSAHRACLQWQARGKAHALEAEFPHWIAARKQATSGPESASLDLGTVMKATRAISGEMELPGLLDALMQIVIENAGAQRGVLLLDQDGGWQVVAQGEIGKPQLTLAHPLPMEASGMVASSVVRYVARTRETVVLDDATTGRFATDPIIRERGTKSLICAPLLGRGRLIGVFYVENNLAASAFTPARVQLLEILLAQAATSLENARTFEALRVSEAKYRRLFDTTTEGIMALDAEGRISFGNARMAQLLGYSLDEMLGRPFAHIVHPDDVKALGRRLESRRHGVCETYELRFRCKDGRTVWTVASATPIMEEGRFAGSFAMFTDISERRRAENELRRSNRFLRTLSRCNETLVHATDEQTLLRDMCEVVVESGSFALAWVGYLGSDLALKVMGQFGTGSPGLPDTPCLSNPPSQSCCPAMRAALSNEIQVVPRVNEDPCVHWRTQAAAQGYGSSIALPLRVGGRRIGVLSISAMEQEGFGPEEVALLSELAGDLGFGIDGLRLRRDRELFMTQLRASMEATIQALSTTVERRDPYTAGHQRRVASLARAVAISMEWSEERAQALYLAAMVHDMGKVAVPAEILSKPGQLSAAELLLVRAHVDAGYEILQTVEFPWPLAKIVHQHHERLDGSGYPQGLKGDEICPEARVLAVCDVVEAMVAHRPYRPGLGMERALAEIEAGRGTLYDSDVADHCLRVIREGHFTFT